MEIKNKQINNLSIFCWNIANPSIERAGKQAEWLRNRPEDVLVLTETKNSEGCIFLERYFQAYGYNVVFPKPEGKEFGAMIVSKRSLALTNFSTYVNYLRARVVSVKLDFLNDELEIIAVYIPSRDASWEKINKKKRFLEYLINALKTTSQSSMRIFCGDLNILESNHIPHYHFFKEWEYDFYRSLTGKYQFKDAFRYFYPSVREYSWVGRSGDGYRYDHCFVSENLLPFLRDCYYFHKSREIKEKEIKLSDHSALIMELDFKNQC